MEQARSTPVGGRYQLFDSLGVAGEVFCAWALFAGRPVAAKRAGRRRALTADVPESLRGWRREVLSPRARVEGLDA